MQLSLNDLRSKVEYGLITIKSEEADALIRRLPFEDTTCGSRTYDIARISDKKGVGQIVVHIRCRGQQGPSEARKTAEALIKDLAPKWILVVGIAGSFPNEDISLGDVAVSSLIYDIRISASKPGGEREFAVRTEDLHPSAMDFIARLPRLVKDFSGWNTKRSIKCERPKIDLSALIIKGDSIWNSDVESSLNVHFGLGRKRKDNPLCHAVPFASGAELTKDPTVAKRWLMTGRDMKAVEMELIGVYEACRFAVEGNSVPVISIRGISDIVGLKRDPAWTEYACHSAAAFTVALIKNGGLSVTSVSQRHQQTPSKVRTIQAEAVNLLALGQRAISPKLVSSGAVDAGAVFINLAKEIRARKAQTIVGWNVRPVQYLTIIHFAFLQQLARLAEWGFRVRIVLFDLFSIHAHGDVQRRALSESMTEKICRFKGLSRRNVTSVSSLLKPRDAAGLVTELFGLVRPSYFPSDKLECDPTTILDNMLCMAVEQWEKYDVLLAGGQDAADIWAVHRKRLSEIGALKRSLTLILEFPKITMGSMVTPEMVDQIPHDHDTVKEIGDKLAKVSKQELDWILNLLIQPAGIKADESSRDAHSMASLVDRCFTSSRHLK